MRPFHVGVVAAVLAATVPAAAAERPFGYLAWSDGRVDIIDDSPRSRALAEFSPRPQATIRTIAITWVVDYRDLSEGATTGFADPVEGPARRAALEETLRTIGNTLGGSGSRTVTVRVDRSGGLGPGVLAAAGSPYTQTAAGTHKTDLQRLIQTGVDPEPAQPDMKVAFDFAQRWHTGVGAPPANAFDMRSVALHEITHALGMASLIGPAGTSRLDGLNPGLFSFFDRFIARPGGARLMTAGGNYTGTVADLVGASGPLLWTASQTAAATGGKATLFTPSPYQGGSSLSHWEIRLRQPVMAPAIAPGVRRRVYADYEIAMLRDIGYASAAAPKPLLSFGAAEAFPTTSTLPSAVAVQAFDDKPGADLLVLETPPGSNVAILRIYSGMDPAKGMIIELPKNIDYQRLSAATVGPEKLPGVVLGSREGGRLLALAGVKFRSGQRASFSDLRHVHQVTAPAPAGGSPLARDTAVAAADVNADGLLDHFGFSPQLGFLGFLDDGRGYFDRLRNPREVQAITPTGSIAWDLAPYAAGPGPQAIGLTIPATRSIVEHFIFNVLDPSGATSSARMDTGNDGYGPRATARVGILGFSVLQNYSGDQDLAAVNFASSPHKVTQRWTDVPAIRGLEVLKQEPYEAFVTTANHTLERVRAGSPTLSRVAGSTAGHRDGPAAQALFNTPGALCVDGRRLYVVDTGNALIRRVDLDTLQVSTLAGQKGIASAVDGAAGVGTLQFKGGQSGIDACAVLGDSLYALNSGGPNGPFSLRKINLNNGYISTVPPNEVAPFEGARHLAAEGSKLFYIQGPPTSSTLRSLELFPAPQVEALSAGLRFADVDRDGFVDLLSLYEGSLRSVAVHRNLGDGTFRRLSTTLVPAAGLAMDVRLVDRDSNLDLIVATANAIEVLQGDGKGGFTPDPSRRLPLLNINWMVVNDINGDGRPDVAILDSARTLRVFLGDAEGRWGAGPGNDGEHFVAGLDVSATWFDLRDVDGNGSLDLLVRPTGTAQIVYLPGKP